MFVRPYGWALWENMQHALDRRFNAIFHYIFFFQAEDGIRDGRVTGVQTCALPISRSFFCACRNQRGLSTISASLVTANDSKPTSIPTTDSLKGNGSVSTMHEKQAYHLPFSFLRDRKSTRLNSSHPSISYAVFCLKK